MRTTDVDRAAAGIMAGRTANLPPTTGGDSEGAIVVRATMAPPAGTDSPVAWLKVVGDFVPTGAARCEDPPEEDAPPLPWPDPPAAPPASAPPLPLPPDESPPPGALAVEVGDKTRFVGDFG